ncbi:MAG TPA: tetratricopeptide repeat protein [Caulobacteraceae bacterium]
MSTPRSLLALLAFSGLCACATPGPRSAAGGPALATLPIDPGGSAYGLFLAGQEAINNGHSGAAADLFGRAATTDGDPVFLANRAFTAALLAGDVKRAAAIAPAAGGDEPDLVSLGLLVRGVEALADGDGKQARVLLTGPALTASHKVAAELLAPWAVAEAGDAEASIARPVITGEPIAQFFASLDQGKLFERAHRYDEAETTFRALIGAGDPGGIASADLGEMLERRGEGAKAVAIYDQALARNPDDGALKAAKVRALAKGRPPALESIRQSAAEALIAPATVLMIQKQEEGALAYLRLALRLDAGRDEAWVLVGDILADVGDVEGARTAYGRPGPRSDEFVAARGKLAWSYQTAGDKDAALKVARDALAAAPADRDASVTVADLLRADERYDESIAALNPLIAAQADHPDWRLLYMRAVALEESGRWPEAERDLTAALKERPDEPELLNFLGYSWIDRGEKLPAAIAMVQKAVDQDPQSGAMLDSLGWGYYRSGDYKTAVDKLEAAVVLDPGDPDVNNHLGDAYWRVGRRTEAQFQWRRVLTLEPTAKIRAEAEAKLKSGLDGAPVPSLVAGQ